MKNKLTVGFIFVLFAVVLNAWPTIDRRVDLNEPFESTAIRINVEEQKPVDPDMIGLSCSFEFVVNPDERPSGLIRGFPFDAYIDVHDTCYYHDYARFIIVYPVGIISNTVIAAIFLFVSMIVLNKVLKRRKNEQ